MLDRIDKKILDLLQTDSSISNQQLADKVSLSPSPCLRRVKQLEEEGYISKQVAILNPEKLGLSLTIMVLVRLSSHTKTSMNRFEKQIKAIPEVIQCYLIAGQSADYLLKTMVTDIHRYQQLLLEQLTNIDSVSSVHSSFVLQTIVDKTKLPLDQLVN